MDLKDTLQNALNGIASNAGASTVIGDPIETMGGTVIIPVSKVMLGNVSAGLDDAESKNAENKNPGNKFIGGGGSGVTVNPVAFLVVGADGSVELLNIGEKAASDPVSSIVSAVERSPELIERFKTVFSKDKNKEE
jgi:sporulation protein YtfJ